MFPLSKYTSCPIWGNTFANLIIKQTHLPLALCCTLSDIRHQKKWRTKMSWMLRWHLQFLTKRMSYSSKPGEQRRRRWLDRRSLIRSHKHKQISASDQPKHRQTNAQHQILWESQKDWTRPRPGSTAVEVHGQIKNVMPKRTHHWIWISDSLICPAAGHDHKHLIINSAHYSYNQIVWMFF